MLYIVKWSQNYMLYWIFAQGLVLNLISLVPFKFDQAYYWMGCKRIFERNIAACKPKTSFHINCEKLWKAVKNFLWSYNQVPSYAFKLASYFYWA